MTHNELQATVEKAVHEMNYYSVKSHTVAAVVAALAPLVVKPEPGLVTLDDGMVITYHADNPKRWHWTVNGMHGDAHRLAHLNMSDEELVRCLALREPVVDGDAALPLVYWMGRATGAEQRAHAAEARLQRARAVLVGEP